MVDDVKIPVGVELPSPEGQPVDVQPVIDESGD